MPAATCQFKRAQEPHSRSSWMSAVPQIMQWPTHPTHPPTRTLPRTCCRRALCASASSSRCSASMACSCTACSWSHSCSATSSAASFSASSTSAAASCSASCFRIALATWKVVVRVQQASVTNSSAKLECARQPVLP